nr:hypothetical protein [Tanacetum cinerariifolium]
MATTLEQQVALDETLVPSAQRLRIGQSNFRLPSDIQSKEPTLQVVYDVLRNSPFFKAFLVLDLEAFREMLHISPRISGQYFAELPFEEEILEFFRKPSIPRRNRVNWHYVRDDVLFSTIKVRGITKTKGECQKRKGGSASSTTPFTLTATPTPITTVVAAPRLSAATKGKQPARATTPTEPTEVERTEAEQLKIVLRRNRQETHISQQHGSGTDEGTGSKPGVPDVPSDDSEEELSWNSSDDEDVDEQTKGREQSEGDKTDESDDDDDDQDEAEKGNDDNDDEEETSKIGEQEVTKSDRESEDEETREQDEESFDPIPRTPKDNEDDDNNEEDQGLRIGKEERMQEEEEADELYRGVNINQGWGLQVSQETEDSYVILTLTQSDAQQESSSTSSLMTNLLNPLIDPGMESIFTTGSTTVTPIPSPQSTMTPSIISTFTSASQLPTPPTQIPSLDLQSLPTFASVFRFKDRAQVTRILPRIEEDVNAQLEAEVLTRSSHSSRTSYAVAANLSEMELKKILIDKMEGNKSIQRLDEQRNLYKALVEAYDAHKTILDTYGESAILKRRRED